MTVHQKIKFFCGSSFWHSGQSGLASQMGYFLAGLFSYRKRKDDDARDEKAFMGGETWARPNWYRGDLAWATSYELDEWKLAAAKVKVLVNGSKIQVRHWTLQLEGVDSLKSELGHGGLGDQRILEK